jgi:hypothetical protein
MKEENIGLNYNYLIEELLISVIHITPLEPPGDFFPWSPYQGIVLSAQIGTSRSPRFLD